MAHPAGWRRRASQFQSPGVLLAAPQPALAHRRRNTGRPGAYPRGAQQAIPIGLSITPQSAACGAPTSGQGALPPGHIAEREPDGHLLERLGDAAGERAAGDLELGLVLLVALGDDLVLVCQRLVQSRERGALLVDDGGAGQGLLLAVRDQAVAHPGLGAATVKLVERARDLAQRGLAQGESAAKSVGTGRRRRRRLARGGRRRFASSGTGARQAC